MGKYLPTITTAALLRTVYIYIYVYVCARELAKPVERCSVLSKYLNVFTERK